MSDEPQDVNRRLPPFVGAVTGRMTSQPEMQNLKPSLSEKAQALASEMCDMLHEYQKPLYDVMMSDLPMSTRIPMGRTRRPVLSGVDLASGKDETALAIIAADGVAREIVHLDKLRTCSGSRKVDRQYIARALILLATAHGAQVERTDERSSITLRIGVAGVGALIDVDAALGGDSSIISWHNIEHPARNFTPRFCKLVGGGMFARPHHKATSLPGDWYSLAMALDAGLLLAARQEAFAPV